jgi:hypothetical protein
VLAVREPRSRDGDLVVRDVECPGMTSVADVVEENRNEALERSRSCSRTGGNTGAGRWRGHVPFNRRREGRVGENSGPSPS